MNTNVVRRATLTAAIIFVISTSLPGWAQAQAPVHDVYLVSSFENNNNSYRFDQPIRIVNPGRTVVEAETAIALVSTICANIYVFNTEQEMLECCSCPVSENGLITVTLSQLTDRSILGAPINAGVIKIVATTPTVVAEKAVCDPGSYANTVVPTLRAWMTHFESINTTAPIPVSSAFLNVQAFDHSDLSATNDLSTSERKFLPTACQFIEFLGSGKGVCRCPAGG